MEKVYVISRYAAKTKKERRFHEQVARYFCRRIVEEGKQPVAPHLFYPQFLEDGDRLERKIGLELALNDLSGCSSFLLVTVDGIISEGMRGEIAQISRTRMHGQLAALTRAEAKKLIEGGEADGAGRDQHRSDSGLRGGIFRLHKKA